MRYAKGTSVSVEKSRGEIERTLKRFGASEFAYAWKQKEGLAIIAFKARNLQIKFTMRLPLESDDRFTKTSYGSDRSQDAAERLWEAEAKQSWRALALLVKAKLAAVEASITSFEEEFLSHIVIPHQDGRISMVGEWLIPQLPAVYQNRPLPPLLQSGTEA
jgi:hypothetical protein